jgi:hypothetical protein
LIEDLLMTFFSGNNNARATLATLMSSNTIEHIIHILTGRDDDVSQL